MKTNDLQKDIKNFILIFALKMYLTATTEDYWANHVLDKCENRKKTIIAFVWISATAGNFPGYRHNNYNIRL